MISSLTQTYGNHRLELFQFKSLDRQDIAFRRRLGATLLTFHGSEPRLRDEVLSRGFCRSIGFSVHEYDRSLSYPRTLERAFQALKEQGARYVLFLEDDVFSLATQDLFDELHAFVTSQDFPMLSLEVTSKEIRVTPRDVLWRGDRLEVYGTSSEDFRRAGLWAIDGGAFVADVDFMLEHVLDDGYFSKPDIWSGKEYLKKKIEAAPIPRYCTNARFFWRASLFSSNMDRITGYIFLRSRFPEARDQVLRALKAHLDGQDAFEERIEALLHRIEEQVARSDREGGREESDDYRRGVCDTGRTVVESLAAALSDLKRSGGGRPFR